MILSDEEKRDVYTDTIDATDWSYIDYANAIERAVLAKASQQVQGDADNQLISMGMDQPVSMYRAVSKLIEAADILLNQKNYDGTGHELITEAKNQAKGYLRSFRPLPAPKQEPLIPENVLASLYECLPFVEDAEFNEGYKPSRIKKVISNLKGAIESLEVSLKAPPQAAAIPEYYQEEWKRNVMLMWSCVRKHDSSIPSDVLDFMREFLLSAAPKPEGEQ